MLSRLIVGILTGVAVTPALAHGGPAPGSPAATAEPAPAARITLVTGDTVELAPAQAGRYAATVDPAPGRERITFHTLEVDGGLRVVPSDAVPLIAAGRLDADLFDVQRLIADGYGDAASPTLPLIVRGGGAAQRGTRTLPSINATTVAPAKDTLADFWRGQTGARLAAPGTIFLDGKVRATLDRSAAQIGAPQAWQRGLDGRGVKVAVLDTGIDATHPDLAGKVVETRNFSTSADTVDHFGHGTHVAATIAGTGQASGGSRKGIAYGADLLVGKVLGDDGVGFESQIIEGMQWAAGSGAKVVNMSLGGDPTDGLDPMSLAVDELSRQSGTLFVVAAGNAGGTATVGSPGAARDALTVGAVDRADQIADFSSRGPRLGDQGLKPEITAPGVDIVAARAAGTTMGNPVDSYYTAASGTSMATPHVAGAAAILAQEHPEWTGAALKDALVSTAQTTPDLPVYAQGAGRVDVARATGQAVTGTGVADFGLHTVGATPTSGTRTVTYANSGSTPVSLALAAPAAVKLSAATVTVPAHGTATVDATVDFESLPLGTLSGWITATATGGLRVTTAVGAVKDGPVHRVTVRALDRAGQPTAVPVLTLMGDDARSDVLGWAPDGGASFEVHEGTYLLHALIEDGARSDEQATLTAIPELKVDRDIEVLVDARKGTPIRIETPRPAEQQAVLSYYVHRVTGSGRDIAHGVMHFSNVGRVNVVPTKPVRAGSFEFSSRWQLVAPMVQASLGEPVDLNLMGNSPAWDGTRKFALAKWGDRDVRGKAVLIPPDDQDELVKIDEAARAGAAVALVVRPPDFSTWTSWSPEGERLPVVSLVLDQATADTIVRKMHNTLSLTLTTSSPYLYDVIQVSKGRVPESIVHRVTAANSMRVTASYADNGGFDWVREQRFGWRPWQAYAWNDVSRDVRTPSVREEWVSAGDSLWQQYVADDYPWLFGPLAGGFRDAPRSYQAGHATTTWAAPVVRPTDVGSNRTGDVLHLRVPALVDHDGHYAHIATDQVDATLWRDGSVVAELPDGWQDVTTTPGDAAYRLRVSTAHGGEDWTLGTRTETEWTFRSGKAGDLPLLTVDYDVREKGVALGFPARLRTLRVDVSTDDGVSWRQATVRDGTALVPAGRTPVSLRVRATDRAGNTVDQTVIRAYARG